MRQLFSQGHAPEMVLIESGFGEAWRERESFWIDSLRDSCRLLNMRNGGDGRSFVVVTEEVRAKQSASGKARCAARGPMPEETRAKLRAANVGKKMSDEARAKLSAAKRGWQPTDETRERMSAAMRRRMGCPDERAKYLAVLAACRAAQQQAPPRPQWQVLCVETGEVFASPKIAAAAAGVSAKRIRTAVALGKRCGEYHYARPSTPDPVANA
jgi:plasmid stability protein